MSAEIPRALAHSRAHAPTRRGFALRLSRQLATLGLAVAASCAPAAGTGGAGRAISLGAPGSHGSPEDGDAAAAVPSFEPSPPSAAAEALGEGGAGGEMLDDSAENESVTEEARVTPPHPLDGLSQAAIDERVQRDLGSLGSMSIGSPNAGALLNGIQATETPFFKPVEHGSCWATQETLDFLTIALRRVHSEFPDSPALALGDISARGGGRLSPHVSHQAGRDVDIGFFYRDGARWYTRGTEKNLDLPRNWAFVRALAGETDVDLILVDREIQVLLERYALEQGEDPTWLGSVFRGVPGRLRPLIRHAKGHATHFHVRFFNPLAQETARLCLGALVKHGVLKVPPAYLTHRVKKNETLGMIAKKYGTTVLRLRAENHLKTNVIGAGRALAIPTRRAAPPVAPGVLRLPPRRPAPPRHPPELEPRAG